jgi:methionyl-tRNA formyltransferase
MPLRAVFFGTPAAAVPTLVRLRESSHEVLAVVTAPDRPKGRGMEVAASPVKEAALAAGLPVLQPPTLKDPAVQSELAALGADVFVVCAYGLILPRAVLETPRLGAVNVHFSLLPAYRGAAPVAWAVLDGRGVSGVTIMQMDPGLDTGPILEQAEEPVRPDDDTGALEGRLAEVGAMLLVSVLDRLEAGTVSPQPQDDSTSTYAAKLTPEAARIDWSEEAKPIARRIRAFSPRPGAWTTLGGRRLKVWRASVPEAWSTAAGAAPPGPVPPGSVTAGPGGAMVVATGGGPLVLEEVQPEGGRRMAGSELLRGLRGAPVLE